MPDVHRLIEDWLPWFDRGREEERDATSKRIASRATVAQVRAAHVIAEYRLAEGVASQKGQLATDAVTDLRDAQDAVGATVTDLRDAQEAARVAGEAVIAEIERK